MEADRRKRRDGTPSRLMRSTVLKIADSLQVSREDALLAAGLSLQPLPDQADFVPPIQKIYDSLDPEDQEDLLQLALLKWKRAYPTDAPHSLVAEDAPSTALFGDFLCLDVETGRLISACEIEPTREQAAGEEEQALLRSAFLRFLSWQDGITEHPTELAQDLQQMRRILKSARLARI